MKWCMPKSKALKLKFPNYFLPSGGSLVFDEADIELNAEYIIITEGGHFEIGTHEKPFEHKATVTMHGHVRSTELPLFGAKTFAVRNGTVDMHGKKPEMLMVLSQLSLTYDTY